MVPDWGLTRALVLYCTPISEMGTEEPASGSFLIIFIKVIINRLFLWLKGLVSGRARAFLSEKFLAWSDAYNLCWNLLRSLKQSEKQSVAVVATASFQPKKRLFEVEADQNEP